MPLNSIEYLTNLIAEESAELAQACNKANRFGIMSIDPVNNVYVLDRIMNEWWDVFSCMILLKNELESLDVNTPVLFNDKAIKLKIQKVFDFISTSIKNGSYQNTSDEATLFPTNHNYKSNESTSNNDEFLNELIEYLNELNNQPSVDYDKQTEE